MWRNRVSWLMLPVALFVASASFLPAQEPFANTRPPGKNPNVAANPGVEDWYVPSKPGLPFTGKSVVTWTRGDGSGPQFAFMSMLARDSSGKLYFESRRRMAKSGDLQPRSNFGIIDAKEETRTTCYVATKTCRVDAFRHSVYPELENTEDAPRALTTESLGLGTSVIDELTGSQSRWLSPENCGNRWSWTWMCRSRKPTRAAEYLCGRSRSFREGSRIRDISLSLAIMRCWMTGPRRRGSVAAFGLALRRRKSRRRIAAEPRVLLFEMRAPGTARFWSLSAAKPDVESQFPISALPET